MTQYNKYEIYFEEDFNSSYFEDRQKNLKNYRTYNYN